MPPAFATLVVAHQGGWDEILLVVAPVVLLAALLWLANRRADQSAGPDPVPVGDDLHDETRPPTDAH